MAYDLTAKWSVLKILSFQHREKGFLHNNGHLNQTKQYKIREDTGRTGRMILLYIILLLLILFFVYDLVRGIRVKMHAVLTSNTMKMNISALNALIRAVVDFGNGTPYLTVYLRKVKLFALKLARNKASNTARMAKSLKIEDFDISTSYGFEDPFITAMVSGLLGILASFVRIRRLTLAPNFMSDEQYVFMDASASIKVGHTIWGYLKNKTKGE